MPTPSLDDETLSHAVAARAAHKSALATASALGISENALRNRLLRAAARGLDGNVAGVTPLGQVIKGTTTLYDSEGGQMLQWVRRDREPDPLAVAAAIKDSFADFKPMVKAVKPPRPTPLGNRKCTLLAAGDLHVGMYAHGEEAGDNWDLKIGERVIGECVADVVAGSDAAELGLVVFGGDYFHADNNRNETSRSHNPLDVDGRYQKVIGVGSRMAVNIVDLSLTKHQRLIVRVLRGNHDENSSVALAYFLLAWYRNEPRVTIDVDPSLFFWHRFGEVQLGFTHGHETKIQQLPQVMAAVRAADWGLSKFRYCHGFHLHNSQKYVWEGGGCISEVHQTPIPKDGWHFGRGYLSGRSMQSITYHAHCGEIGRKRTVILDNVVLPANDNFKKAA